MKKTLTILFSVIASCTLFIGCSDNGVNVAYRPSHGLSNVDAFEIDNVLLTDSSTIIKFDTYYSEPSGFKIVEDTYIQADGKKYVVKEAQGIKLGGDYEKKDTTSFTLIFPALPKGTKSFDFIESDCDNCFKIWDIQLTNKPIKYEPNLPSDIISFKTDNTATLPEVEFKTGKTKLTFHITGLKDGYYMDNTQLVVYNLFTLENEYVAKTKVSDNQYEFEFDQYATACAILYFNDLFVNIILSPGEHAEFFCDVTARSINKSRYNPRPDLVYAGFKGEYAQVNNQLNNSYTATSKYRLNIDKLAEETDLPSMSIKQYIDRVVGLYYEKQRTAAADSIPAGVKQYIEAGLKGDIIYCFTNYQNMYIYSYKKRNGIDPSETVSYKPPQMTDKELELLKDIDLNNHIYLCSPSFLSAVKRLIKYTGNSKYLSMMVGSDKSIYHDLQNTQNIFQKALSLEPISAQEQTTLNKTSVPFFGAAYNYMAINGKKLYDEITNNPKGFEIVQTSGLSPSTALDNVLAQHKGKPILVDFWGTWCPPCMNGIAALESFKSELQESGVVLVNVSIGSPKVAWASMLSDMGGIHCYFTNDEWNDLGRKYKPVASGIPVYMFYNKTGDMVYSFSGYSHDTFENKIREGLDKIK